MTDELIRQLAEAQAYLNNTDFYYIRRMEIGTEIPPEIIAKRIEKRQFIVDNTPPALP